MPIKLYTKEEKEKIKREIEDKITIKTIQYIKGLCTEKAGNIYITDLLQQALKNEIIIQRDIDNLNKRAKGRGYIRFYADILKSFFVEVEMGKEFIKIMKKNGEEIKLLNYGSKDRGRSRIANYNSKPDVILIWNKSEMKMDLKNRKAGQIFKTIDIKMYRQNNAGMIVRTKDSFWIYFPEAVIEIEKIFNKNPEYIYSNKKMEGRKCIKMGNQNGNIPLKSFFAKGLIKKIEREDK